MDKNLPSTSKDGFNNIQIKEEILSEAESSSTSSIDELTDTQFKYILGKRFNPLYALYATDLDFSTTKHKQYDNLAQFESALEKCGVELVGKRNKFVPDNSLVQNKKENPFKKETVEERNFLPHQMPVQGNSVIKPKHNRNIFKFMEDVEGPLALLQNKYIINKNKIYVYTRNQSGIHGLVVGNLIAFDKHWNLLIENACETVQRRKFKYSTNRSAVNIKSKDCSQRLKKLGITLPETEVQSLNRKSVEIRKSYKQLMLRGEQIVLIAERLANKKGC